MKLKRCACCKDYTMKETCDNKDCDCKEKTKSAHYKHVKIKPGKTGKVKGKA